MVDFSVSEHCKICGKKGAEFFSKSYKEKIFEEFFNLYYGQSKYEILKNKLENINYVLLICSECKFIWQKFAPTNEFSENLYENIIDKTESLKKSEKKFAISKKRNKKEIDLISIYFGEKVNILDFGAGWGHWLASSSENNIDKYAFEISSSRGEYLKKKKLKVLDYNSITRFKNYFHYIRMDQVLEHLDKIDDILTQLKISAKSNCIFYISVPNGTEIFKMKKALKIEKGPAQPLEHLNCFTRYSLIKLLSKHGFKKISFIEILHINLTNFKFDILSLKLIINDIKNHFFSTTIKFKTK